MEYEIVRDLLALVDASPLGVDVIAQRANISPSTIPHWRNRVKAPRIDTMSKLAAFFGFVIQIDGQSARLVNYAAPPIRPRAVDPRHGLSPHKMRMLLRSMK